MASPAQNAPLSRDDPGPSRWAGAPNAPLTPPYSTGSTPMGGIFGMSQGDLAASFQMPIPCSVNAAGQILTNPKPAQGPGGSNVKPL